MKLSLTTSGLLDPKRLDSWVPEKRRAIRKAVESAMKTVGREMADAARSRMQSAFKVRKAGFLKSMRAKVYAGSPERFPALLIGSKISWLGLHMKGGTITGKRGKLLIPLLPEHQRIGRRAFKRVIDGLMRAGNAFFIERQRPRHPDGREHQGQHVRTAPLQARRTGPHRCKNHQARPGNSHCRAGAQRHPARSLRPARHRACATAQVGNKHPATTDTQGL
jgi:hypothetical protein